MAVYFRKNHWLGAFSERNWLVGLSLLISHIGLIWYLLIEHWLCRDEHIRA